MDIINFILKNQITSESWNDINKVLADHNNLITTIALEVSKGNYGKGDERAAALGIYND